MIDKSIEPYLNYLRSLSEKKFTGKIKFELNWRNGGISNMNIESQPLPGVTEEESVRLK